MKAIKPNVYIISWSMWSGKTMLATCMSASYSRVYANYHIEGLKNFIYFNTVRVITSLTYEEEKGVIIFDESLININSKDFAKKENRDIVEKILVYCRKINTDLIFCTQIKDAIDKNIRELATYIVKCNNISNWDYPYFSIERQIWRKNDIIKRIKHNVDLLAIMRALDLNYNTLELSTNKRKSKKEEEE